MTIQVNGTPISGPQLTTFRTDLGVNNVSNTADADKPISTATQNALNGKADTGHAHSIGSVTLLQETLDQKASLLSVVQLTASTTLSAASHANRIIYVNSASAVTLTAGDATAFATGDTCRVYQVGAGAVTIAVSGAQVLTTSPGVSAAATTGAGGWLDVSFNGTSYNIDDRAAVVSGGGSGKIIASHGGYPDVTAPADTGNNLLASTTLAAALAAGQRLRIVTLWEVTGATGDSIFVRVRLGGTGGQDVVMRQLNQAGSRSVFDDSVVMCMSGTAQATQPTLQDYPQSLAPTFALRTTVNTTTAPQIALMVQKMNAAAGTLKLVWWSVDVYEAVTA